MPRWIDQRLRSANISANQEAIEILADRVEGNLLAAVQEIEKLKLLGSGGDSGWLYHVLCGNRQRPLQCL